MFKITYTILRSTNCTRSTYMNLSTFYGEAGEVCRSAFRGFSFRSGSQVPLPGPALPLPWLLRAPESPALGT
jgi:hypothetical protein